MNDDQQLPALDQLTFGGERVSHLYPNDCYFAHLSLYDFALPFARGKVVLDAGSGSGYGSNFLAENGAAQVQGVDASSLAVRFCQASFKRPNLQFRQVDLQRMEGFPDQYFDLIFSSNTLEHVFEVAEFLRAAHAMLKPDGALIVAVPPIVGEASREANLVNPYHLNIWTPRQWYETLSGYFDEIQAYRHFFDKPGITLDFANAPQQTKITERDFQFQPIPLAALYQLPTLTALFAIRKPRPVSQLPARHAPLQFVENSFTRPPTAQSPENGEQPERVQSSATNRSLWTKSLHALRRGGPRQLAHEAYRYWLWQTHRRRI